jgi:hypothetical protein
MPVSIDRANPFILSRLPGQFKMLIAIHDSVRVNHFH